MAYTIRPLKRSEWLVFKEFRLSALLDTPDAFGGIHRDEIRKSNEWWQDFIDYSNIHGAFDGNKIIGIIGYLYPSKYNDKAALPVSVYVAPDHRGKGVNHMMFEALASHIRANTDAIGIDLDHAEGNKKAQRSYEAMGFIHTGNINGGITRTDGTTVNIRLYHKVI